MTDEKQKEEKRESTSLLQRTVKASFSLQYLKENRDLLL